jgi:N-methylhydantoinase B
MTPRSSCEHRQLSSSGELAFVTFAVILGTLRNQVSTVTRMQAHVDPITRAVVQHRLSAIVAEMGEAMLRTSYSQILNSSRDFSLAICDVQARLIAQADHIPVHVGALPWATRAVEERIRDVQPGDVILMNDPYHGGSHLPDVTAFVPVFDGGKRLFWTIVRAHQSDIGGATHGAYNPMATEIYQEGLRIPPMKLYEAGRLREDVLDMIALNIRNPRDFRGDLAAMVGAAHLGERRLAKLFTEFDAATVAQAIGDILDASEQQTRAIVATWKDGVFHGEALLDDDGHGRSDIRIAAKVTKRGSDIEVDLSGSDPQTTSFVNSSHANMQAAVAMAFAYLIDADIPKNSGALRPLKVIAKQGTIVWADPGLPVTMCTSHPSNEIVEAIIKAMAGSCPERTMGGWGRRFRIAIQGEDPRTGRGFIWHMFHARPGGGASVGGDGWSSIGEWHSVGGIKFGSVEVAEVRFPLHFGRHEFRPDSGGKGRYRGGLGVDLDLKVEVGKPAKANTAGDGARHGACGMLGGQDGQPHHYRLVSNGKDDRILKTKEVGVVIAPGDVLQVHSGGGGGWGDPRERTAEAERRDLAQGLITQTSGVR